MRFEFARGTIVLTMAEPPTIKRKNSKPQKRALRLFRARFPNGTSMQSGHTSRVLTHAYLVLYERPDAKDGFQRGFCSSLDQVEAKVDAEMRWLSRHRYTLIEAFIIDVQDITGKIKHKK